MKTSPAHVVVIGGGIAGLAAALRVRDTAPAGTRITVIEQAERLGGKLRTGEVGGVRVEDAAEAFLFRRPQAVALARRVGLGEEFVHPTTLAAAVSVDGALRPLPAGTLMGMPAGRRRGRRHRRAHRGRPDQGARRARPGRRPARGGRERR